MDSQSVKNTDTGGNKVYDAGKKVSGIKRHLIVDTQGLLHGIAITPANVTDRAGALQAIERYQASLHACQGFVVDGGYTGESFANQVKQRLPQAHVHVIKRVSPHAFAVLPQRWIVERTFAWFEKCRRLWKNCERLLNTSLQFTVLSHLALLLRS